MPRPRFTEDIEFRTDVDTAGNIVRRGRFIRRPRRVGGRNIPGNARYYRRRQNELLDGPRAAQRRGRGADRTRANAQRAGRNAGNPRAAGGGRQVTPRGRGGIRGVLARVARGVADRLERRRTRRR